MGVRRDHPPEPGVVNDLDGLVHALTALRLWAGNPAYAVLADGIGKLRVARGIPGRPGKVTVYDCFRVGRKRMDAQLFADLIEVLGVPQRGREAWLEAYRTAIGAVKPINVVTSPAHLMPPRTRLIGRAEELAAAEARPPGSMTMIVGLPGAGKTELALHTAHRWRSRLGPNVVALGMNLRGYDPDLAPLSAAAVIGRMLSSLGVPASAYDGLTALPRAELLRETIGKRPAVLLLDNADAASQVLPVLPLGERWRVLVTSRRRLPELERSTGSAIVLGELSLAASVQLLGEEVGAARVAAEPDAAVEIAQRCGRLALDLRLAGAAIKAEPDEWTLSDHAARLSALPADELMRPALRLSYQAIAEPVRRTLRLASLHPGPQFSVNHLVALTGLSEAAVVGQLKVLVAEHLMMAEAEGYQLHDLVRAFGLRQLIVEEPRSQQLAAMKRFAEALIADARDHALIGRPESVWLEQNFPVLMSFAEIAPEWSLGVELGELVMHYSEFLDMSGRLAEAEELIRLALAQPQVPNQRELRRKLGRVLELRGDFDEALIQLEAVADPDHPEYGRALNGIGNVLKRSGRCREAVSAYCRAVRHSRNAMGKGRALGNLADTMRVLTHEAIAERLFGAAEELSREADDQINLAILLGNRCLLVEQQGRVGEAAVMATEAAQRFDELGFVAPSLTVQQVVLRTAIADGDLDAARTGLAAAMTRAETAGLLTIVYELRLVKGGLFVAEGQVAAGVAECVDVVTQARAVGAQLILAAAYNRIGELLIDSDPGAARDAFDSAMQLAQVNGDGVELARARRGLRGLGDDDQGQRC